MNEKSPSSLMPDQAKINLEYVCGSCGDLTIYSHRSGYPIWPVRTCYFCGRDAMLIDGQTGFENNLPRQNTS